MESSDQDQENEWAPSINTAHQIKAVKLTKEITSLQGHGMQSFVVQGDILDGEIKKQIQTLGSLEEDEEKEGVEEHTINFYRRIRGYNYGRGALGINSFPATTPFAGNQYRAQMKKLNNIEPYWWYVDSGATEHVTKYLANFRSFSPCKDFMRFGNGGCLKVEHTGSSQFSLGNRSYILTELYHVPQMSKNFISVCQFSKDNGVLFQFDPFFCYVNDRETGQVLVVGHMFEGLYRLQITLL